LLLLLQCLEAGNLGAASLLETLAENHEQALKHNLDAAAENQEQTEAAIEAYVDTVGQKSPSIEQVTNFNLLFPCLRRLSPFLPSLTL
jgi:hypothetical protein